MIERTVRVVNKEGIHLRPAERIAQTAGAFKASVALRNGDCRVNAKSILGILALEAALGAEVTLIAEGPDDQEAAAALEKLFAEGFGEELA